MTIWWPQRNVMCSLMPSNCYPELCSTVVLPLFRNFIALKIAYSMIECFIVSVFEIFCPLFSSTHYWYINRVNWALSPKKLITFLNSCNELLINSHPPNSSRACPRSTFKPQNTPIMEHICWSKLPWIAKKHISSNIYEGERRT